jgi:hypothetical protein
MKRTWIIGFLLSVLVVCQGCATFVHWGSKQEIPITSEPTGAVATTDGYSVKTPGTLKLPRDKSHFVSIEKEGYKNKQVNISSSASPWMWGNCLLGGLIGLGVDLGTGGGYELNPDKIYVNLEPEKKVEFGLVKKIGSDNVSKIASPQSNKTEFPKHQDEPIYTGVVGVRWAVIIGISGYQDTRIPSLRYASADAKAFYDWIVSPEGGKYAPSRVKLLTNEQATGKNIKDALFTWLKQAIDEDVVTIYFAGHGSPNDPESPDNLFLYPYDTQYNNVATTGFPMWDIETALKRFIKAKKVIVVADACHAGGVGQPFDVAQRGDRGVGGIANPIATGLQNLSKVGDGICVISASGDKQLSKEGQEWGGGHGVFTYFLLKGLKGEADYNKDERVTLGELIPFLSEQVRRETRNKQSPTVAGKFDPALGIGR